MVKCNVSECSCRYDEKEQAEEEEPSYSDGIVYQVVSSLRVHHQPDGASDNEVFDTQPKVQALDSYVSACEVFFVY